MTESNLHRAKKGDLILVHSADKSRPVKASKSKSPATLLLVWDTASSKPPHRPDIYRRTSDSSSENSSNDAASRTRAISLTDLLPRKGQRQALGKVKDPDEFCRLLYEVVIDPLFKLNGSFEPLVRPVGDLVEEEDWVFLRPSSFAVRKVWLEDRWL